MIPFINRRNDLRERALNYIREHLKSKFKIGDLSGYFDNNGEMQLCTIESIEIVKDEIFINHIGSLSTEKDYENIVESSTDLICTIADRIHFEPLKHFEK